MEITNRCEEKVQNIKTQYNLIGANLKAIEKKTKSVGAETIVIIPRGTANALKPDLLTSSITAGEVETWMDKWKEYKLNSVFGSQGEESVLAYLRSCVSQEILVSIDYRKIKSERDFLDKLQDYIEARLHPKRIGQLEVMHTRQKQGSSLLNMLSQQTTLFYETGMDKNSPE